METLFLLKFAYLPRNEADICTYHPGAPFFHDAYKGRLIKYFENSLRLIHLSTYALLHLKQGLKTAKSALISEPLPLFICVTEGKVYKIIVKRPR